MESKKPKIIIESFHNNECIHLMVRLDHKNQVKYLLKFLRIFIVNKNNIIKIKNSLSGTLKFETFSSFRVNDKNSTLDFLVIDEIHVAFIFIVINIPKKYFKKLTSFKVVNYFEP